MPAARSCCRTGCAGRLGRPDGLRSRRVPRRDRSARRHGDECGADHARGVAPGAAARAGVPAHDRYGASPARARVVEERCIERFGTDPRPVLRPDGGAALHQRARARGSRRRAVSLLRQPAVDAEVKLLDETGEIMVRAPFAPLPSDDGDDDLQRETFLFRRLGAHTRRSPAASTRRGDFDLVDCTSEHAPRQVAQRRSREAEDALAAHPAVRDGGSSSARPTNTWGWRR